MKILRFVLLLILPIAAAQAAGSSTLELVRTTTDGGPRHRILDHRVGNGQAIFESTEALEVHFRVLGPLGGKAEGLLVREVLGGSSGDERWSLIAWDPETGKVLDVWRRTVGESMTLEPGEASGPADRCLATLRPRVAGTKDPATRIGFVDGTFRPLAP